MGMVTDRPAYPSFMVAVAHAHAGAVATRMQPMIFLRRRAKGWPACRWLVLRANTHELLEQQMRLDWVMVWG